MADFRDVDIGTDHQPSENEPGFAGHSLSTGSEPARRHYSEPQLKRSEFYVGKLSEMPEERVRALLVEVLSYFELEGYSGLPFPPTGLPGALNRRYSWDDPATELVAIGFDYFLSAAAGKSRAMHNRWEDARTFVRRTVANAREGVLEEIRERERQAAMQEEDRRRASPQLVYFIGAASGPIKIGMATDPEARCKTLQTSHHERLSILATCEGGQPREFEYHRRFAARRLSGEWFERCPEILEEIERLQKELT